MIGAACRAVESIKFVGTLTDHSRTEFVQSIFVQNRIPANCNMQSCNYANGILHNEK